MSDGLEFDYELGEPPEKVWRALSVPEFRAAWLPGEALADPEAIAVTPGQEIRYRMRDGAAPFLESIVTFRIAPNGAGGTSLRVIHDLDDARLRRMPKAAANDDGSPVMRAA